MNRNMIRKARNIARETGRLPFFEKECQAPAPQARAAVKPQHVSLGLETGSLILVLSTPRPSIADRTWFVVKNSPDMLARAKWGTIINQGPDASSWNILIDGVRQLISTQRIVVLPAPDED